MVITHPGGGVKASESPNKAKNTAVWVLILIHLFANSEKSSLKLAATVGGFIQRQPPVCLKFQTSPCEHILKSVQRTCHG